MDHAQKKRLTTGYNIYNNVTCPNLIGDPQEVLKAKSTIQAVAKNATKYMMSYPIAGMDTNYPFGKTVVVKTTDPVTGTAKPGHFYLGPDRSLGSNYFIPMGKCGMKSPDPRCRGQDKWVYMRNIPTGHIPILGNISFSSLTGCNVEGITDGRGIVPGLLEDLSDMSPLSIMEAIGGKGNVASEDCKRMTYPVGKNIYDPKMECTGQAGEDCAAKMWQLETRCTPSHHHMKHSTDLADDRLYPGSPSFGGKSKSYDKKSSLTETFANQMVASPPPPPTRADCHRRGRFIVGATVTVGALAVLAALATFHSTK